MECPHCGMVLEEVTDVTPDAAPRLPKRGDLGVCERCKGWFILLSATDTLALTEAEVSQMPAIKRIRGES